MPDADSFDDYEDPQLHIPRGVTPVSKSCPADGIATGPLDLHGAGGQLYATWKPSSYCPRQAKASTTK